ncbi:MAG: hypothetical protein PHR35_07880 [Kiritimatiellae bacterium]|nr:hypothetical protein [Kiritimatiellia bacterium]
MHTTRTLIEVKWTETPNAGDARHVRVFLREYENAVKGYVICRSPRKMKLDDRVFAIPWQGLPSVVRQV